MQNDEFELPDGSYSVSDIYFNRINNRLELKIKGGYKLELQTSETMKLIGSRKMLLDKQRIGKIYLVFKWLKWFSHNAILQKININKSLSYYMILPQ